MMADSGARMQPGRAVALDQGLLAEMIDCYGAGIIGELVESLRGEAAEGFEALMDAADVIDAALAGRVLHGLRGAALALGCCGFGEAALGLEEAARAGRAPDRAAIAGLAELLAESFAELDRIAGRQAA